jgi:hypothetical protein
LVIILLSIHGLLPMEVINIFFSVLAKYVNKNNINKSGKICVIIRVLETLQCDISWMLLTTPVPI